jgi:hypothetical protein
MGQGPGCRGLVEMGGDHPWLCRSRSFTTKTSLNTIAFTPVAPAGSATLRCGVGDRRSSAAYRRG